MKIVVLEADSVGSDVSWDKLSELGEVKLYDSTPNELIAERIKDADIVAANKCLMNEDSLKDAGSVKLICEAATGYNNVDIEYCRKRNIKVTNVRGYSTDVVAQHTFALLLNLVEKCDYYTTYVKSGAYSAGTSFSHVAKPFHELAGMTIGIVGMGAIGRKVSEIAAAFEMNVIYYSASGNKYDVPYEAVDFDTLLAESDVISIHTPLTQTTQALFGKNAFEKMKKTAILLNLARGPIVVEKDLADALESGEIAAAGLDVYEKEPLPKDSALLRITDRDRLMLTPHVAWGSVEARKRVVEDVYLSIQAFIAGKPRNVVE